MKKNLVDRFSYTAILYCYRTEETAVFLDRQNRVIREAEKNIHLIDRDEVTGQTKVIFH